MGMLKAALLRPAENRFPEFGKRDVKKIPKPPKSETLDPKDFP